MGEDRTFLDWALWLAARGFRVFPLAPGTKRPAFEAWKLVATTDPERIRQWWSPDEICIGFTRSGEEVISNPRFNVGVACGKGLLGLDADVKKGKDGIAVARSLGAGFDGFVVRTPSGGRHEYFRGPDVSNSVGGVGDGVDVRSLGGFLVGPGSVVEGVAYTLEAQNDPKPVPPGVVHACTAVAERRNDAPPAVTPDRPDAVDRAADWLDHTAPLAVEGAGGDVTTFKVAACLKDFGVSEDMAVELMAEHWNDRCSPPWAVDDLKLKVRNAYEYGSRPLGDLHPMADFKGVKLPEPEPAPPSRWFRHGDARGKVDWLYHNLLPKVGVGVLLAPSQAGKTFAALELARCTATGKAFFKVAPDLKGGTLLLFAGSEGSGLALRLDALQEARPLPISACQVGNLAAHDALPGLLKDIQAEARRMLAEFGVPVRLIVLETMAASGLLADENDNSQASLAMNNLSTIAREMDAFVLTSHHPSKDGKGARGASAIPNSADYVLEITRENSIRELSLTKARDAEQRKLGTFTLNPVDLGADDQGRPVTSMVISTGEVMSNAVRQAAHAEKFIQAIEWAIMEDGVEIGPGRVGVREAAAREVFAERHDGSKDRSNIGKLFNAAKGWAEQIGRIEIVLHDEKKFIVLKDVVTPP